MKRVIVAAISLSMSLAGLQAGALAQIKDAPIITGNVDGNCVTSPSVNATGANAGDWTITCGDISPGPGLTVIGPPSAVSEPAPMLAPEPVAAPASEPAPVVAPDTTEPVAADTAVATETDLDADNYADALEAELGLDPSNPDTDADGVADGDELTLYGTAPTLADTDGDGVSDGEELFGIMTDPLVWDDPSTEADTQSMAQEATSAPVQTVEQQDETASLDPGSTENLSATNGDAAALGTGDASAAPGNVTRGGVPVSGAALLGPDGKYSVTENSPPTVSVSGTTSTPPVIEPAPGTEIAPEAVVAPVETSEPVAADTTAVDTATDPAAADTVAASDTDLDADNYADAAELDAGLDPNNPDTDGDGVADGDEVDIYLTDPVTWDSDGDGLADGDELFAASTDPLVWDTNGNGVSDGEELPV